MNAWCRASLVVALVPLVTAVICCERGRARPAEAVTEGIQDAASAASLPAVSGQARTEAKTIFGERCAVCHGDNGEGNGPGSGNLNPKPMNFHNQKWQRSISDARIAKAIVYGGQAVGLSASMAPNPDLESKPEIVAALVERIRKLGR